MKSNHSMSRRVFYLLVRAISTNARNNQTRFVSYKSMYTILWFDALDLAITSAEDMPVEQVREEPSVLARIALMPLRNTCIFNFHDIERYAHTAYPMKEVYDAKMNSAGKTYFESASNNNWASLKEMNRLGYPFLLDNHTDLEAGMNMPPLYPASFLTGKDDFKNKLAEFYTDEALMPAEQTSKITAENDLYTLCSQTICADGVAIARGEVVFKELFTIDEIKEIVAPGGGMGIKGDCFTGIAKLPVEGVTIFIAETNSTFESDVHGKFKSPSIAFKDSYTIKFSKPGFKDVVLLNQKITIHTFKTLHIEMFPI